LIAVLSVLQIDTKMQLAELFYNSPPNILRELQL